MEACQEAAATAVTDVAIGAALNLKLAREHHERMV